MCVCLTALPNHKTKKISQFYSEGQAEVLLLGRIYHCATARKPSADMRKERTVHAGDGVLQLASFWFRACDCKAVCSHGPHGAKMSAQHVFCMR